MILGDRYRRKGAGMVSVLILLLIAVTMVIPAVWAASDTIQASMGDVIPLHGVSHSSDTIYLFLTGPNLPANGVALNDVTKRADQGGFTTVDVDSDQKWVYHWDTSRLNNRLDYGTYTVYVVTDPVDKSRLAGHPFSTLSVYLTNPGFSGVSVSGGTSYTGRPEEHAAAPDITSLLSTVSTPPPTTPVSPPAAPSPSQKSGPGAGLAVMETGALLAVWAIFRSSHR